jgi:beta-N-acetylhexosaminidase
VSWPVDEESDAEPRSRHRVASPPIDDAALGQLLPAFKGSEPPAWLLRRVAAGHAHGVTVFLRAKASDAGQLGRLTERLHSTAPGGLPLLIGADQEGGQLIGLGHDTTRFPGAMALGAAGEHGLTESVGRATAQELRALGITVCYAPVCDLAISPGNVSLGTRTFGSDPAAVGAHAAAFTRGLQAGGVVATPKHFPGFGAVSVDPHYQLGVIEMEPDLLESRELVPFQAAFDAGARMVMSGHVALPGVTGDRTLPATISKEVMHELLRGRMGFGGVSITDAMDMKAMGQGAGQVIDSVVALRAGVDLLLLTPDRAAQRRLEDGLRQAALRGLVPAARIRTASRRIMTLRRWLRGFDWPGRSVLRGAGHLDLARLAAERSITLVRDDAGLLPLRPSARARIAVITPQPRDLTPADSSATEPLDLEQALARHHGDVVSVRTASMPSDEDISRARATAADADVVIVGTMATDTQPAQADLVNALLETGIPTVSVAFRTPYDLADYPRSATHLCAYSVVPASVQAVADVIFGKTPVSGRLPVDIPGLYPRGHGMGVEAWA